MGRWYLYCDDQEHPIAEARTKAELAKKIGINKNTVYQGFKKGWKPYVILDEEDENETD